MYAHSHDFEDIPSHLSTYLPVQLALKLVSPGAADVWMVSEVHATAVSRARPRDRDERRLMRDAVSGEIFLSAAETRLFSARAAKSPRRLPRCSPARGGG